MGHGREEDKQSMQNVQYIYSGGGGGVGAVGQGKGAGGGGWGGGEVGREGSECSGCQKAHVIKIKREEEKWRDSQKHVMGYYNRQTEEPHIHANYYYRR